MGEGGIIADMIKTSGKKGVTNEKIMGLLVTMDERMTNMDDRITDIKTQMATKDDLVRVKQELTSEIRAGSKAVDKDAVTVVSHGKRITVLERRAGVVTK